jgi:hypothetical protein
LRIGLTEDDLNEALPIPRLPLLKILSGSGILEQDGTTSPEAVRAFLEAGRGQALAQLVMGWRHSPAIDDLSLIPHLVREGKWENDPLLARGAIWGFLGTVPSNTWWSLRSLVEDVREKNADFQRTAGDYDSWFIRDSRSGVFLRGFEHWDAVDGELIRFTITGILHWLGVIDLATPEQDGPITAFRLSAWSSDLMAGRAPKNLPLENKPIVVRSNGQIAVPRLAPRPARYQVARYCSWDSIQRDNYLYRLTPSALERARSQGLRVGLLLNLLERTARTMPPNILKALGRWERGEKAAYLENLMVLRLGSPEVLHELRNSGARRFLGDPLGPTTITVMPGAEVKVMGILLEMGYLGEWIESDN